MPNESVLPGADGERLERTTPEAAAEPLTVAQSSSEPATLIDTVEQCLNHHELLDQIGCGGMGVVFRARDTLLNRDVALKMIRSGTLATADEVARFYREARAAARLRHPHIVPIHGIGRYRDQHCFTMDLISGGSLAQQQKRYLGEPRAAVELLEKVARAVHEAHVHGVIHRDLKPGNILLDDNGEPLVGDFGLAKLIDAEVDVTGAGQVVGTPAYMAPEQASGQTANILPQTDVWALGVILFELLTGRRPFVGPSKTTITQQVLHEEPTQPRRLQPKLSRDLEAIVLKCLEKNPKQRYPSAQALADDLLDWRQGRAVLARRPSPLRRAKRLVKRRPLLTVAAALLLLVGSVAGLLGFFLNPERRLRTLEEHLGRGDNVVIVGEGGFPAWHDWRLGPGVFVEPPARDGSCTISSHKPALLDVIRDPQGSYRLRGKIRHDDCTSGGVAGLFFAASKQHTAQGLNQCFLTLTFNDLEANQVHPKTQKPCSTLSLTVRRWYEPEHFVACDLANYPFDPAERVKNGERPWRSVAVEVRPDDFRVFWEGKLVHNVPRTVLDKGFPRLHKQLDKSINRVVDQCPELKPAFSPREALGLYVLQGTASYRDIVVEPIRNP
jgi:hypothetical protein